MAHINPTTGNWRADWHIHRRALLEALSLPTGKLPQNKEDLVWSDISVPDYPSDYPRRRIVGVFNVRLLAFGAANPGHRLQIQCPHCLKWYNFGKVKQHFKVHYSKKE